MAFSICSIVYTDHPRPEGYSSCSLMHAPILLRSYHRLQKKLCDGLRHEPVLFRSAAMAYDRRRLNSYPRQQRRAGGFSGWQERAGRRGPQHLQARHRREAATRTSREAHRSAEVRRQRGGTPAFSPRLRSGSRRTAWGKAVAVVRGSASSAVGFRSPTG
jgi:hypothetical protein